MEDGGVRRNTLAIGGALIFAASAGTAAEAVDCRLSFDRAGQTQLSVPVAAAPTVLQLCTALQAQLAAQPALRQALASREASVGLVVIPHPADVSARLVLIRENQAVSGAPLTLSRTDTLSPPSVPALNRLAHDLLRQAPFTDLVQTP